MYQYHACYGIMALTSFTKRWWIHKEGPDTSELFGEEMASETMVLKEIHTLPK